MNIKPIFSEKLTFVLFIFIWSQFWEKKLLGFWLSTIVKIINWILWNWKSLPAKLSWDKVTTLQTQDRKWTKKSHAFNKDMDKLVDNLKYIGSLDLKFLHLVSWHPIILYTEALVVKNNIWTIKSQFFYITHDIPSE